LAWLHIIIAQCKQFAWAQPAVDKDAKYQVFAAMRFGQETPNFLQRIKSLTRLSQELGRQLKLPSGVALN
jgi:hypothetical protein